MTGTKRRTMFADFEIRTIKCAAMREAQREVTDWKGERENWVWKMRLSLQTICPFRVAALPAVWARPRSRSRWRLRPDQLSHSSASPPLHYPYSIITLLRYSEWIPLLMYCALWLVIETSNKRTRGSFARLGSKLSINKMIKLCRDNRWLSTLSTDEFCKQLLKSPAPLLLASGLACWQMGRI